MRPNRKAITRSQVLAFNKLWNDDDRAQVAQALDDPPRPYLYVHDVPSRTYLTARDADDRVVFWIGSGYIGFPGPKVGAPGLTNSEVWIDLSRHNAVSGREARRDRDGPVCEECFTEVTPAGTCMCEEGPS